MSIPSWARVGMDIVCIDASGAEAALAVGGTYRIKGFSSWGDGPEYFVISGVPFEYQDGWYPRRFRPLIAQSDDISTHFQHHLSNPVREEA